MRYIKDENLKAILSLLFFEHEYLGNHITYQLAIFTMYSKHSFLGKRVSDFLIRV